MNFGKYEYAVYEAEKKRVRFTIQLLFESQAFQVRRGPHIKRRVLVAARRCCRHEGIRHGA